MPGVFDRRATPRSGMQRRPNAGGLSPRAATPSTPTDILSQLGDARPFSGRADARPYNDRPELLDDDMRGIWLAVGAVIGGLAVWVAGRPPAPEPWPIIRFDISAPADHEMLELALAPDGRGVAFVAYAASGGGRPQLFYRALHEPNAVAVPGTDGARSPFFSPDGRSIAFFADDALRRVSLDDGAHAVVCDAPSGSAGGAWSADGTIIFAPLQGRGLLRVPADGGTPEPLTTPDLARQEMEHGWPTWLPDGTGILFTVARRDRDARLAIWSAEEDAWTHLLPANGRPRYAAAGQLVYVLNGELLAAPFDAETLETSGTPTTVLGGIGGSVTGFSGLGDARFDLSRTGTLVYLPPSPPDNVLVWVDRTGRATPAAPEPIADRHRTPRLSPDETRLAVVTRTGLLGHELWLRTLSDGARARLTTGGSDNRSPAWMPPDGRRLSFASNRLGPQNIFVVDPPADDDDADDNDARRLFASPRPQNPGAWSPDGRRLAYYEVTESGRDVWVWSPDAEAVPVAATPSDERSPAWSPDGRWLAYVSNDAGMDMDMDMDEVYVQPYPPTGNRWRISTAGGREPVWSRDGRELFFRRDAEMLAAGVTVRDGALEVETPTRLFERPFDLDPGGHLPNYDVASDGRFLMLQRAERPRAVRVVLGWAP